MVSLTPLGRQIILAVAVGMTYAIGALARRLFGVGTQ